MVVFLSVCKPKAQKVYVFTLLPHANWCFKCKLTFFCEDTELYIKLCFVKQFFVFLLCTMFWFLCVLQHSMCTAQFCYTSQLYTLPRTHSVFSCFYTVCIKQFGIKSVIYFHHMNWIAIQHFIKEIVLCDILTGYIIHSVLFVDWIVTI